MSSVIAPIPAATYLVLDEHHSVDAQRFEDGFLLEEIKPDERGVLMIPPTGTWLIAVSTAKP